MNDDENGKKKILVESNENNKEKVLYKRTQYTHTHPQIELVFYCYLPIYHWPLTNYILHPLFSFFYVHNIQLYNTVRTHTQANRQVKRVKEKNRNRLIENEIYWYKYYRQTNRILFGKWLRKINRFLCIVCMHSLLSIILFFFRHK